MKYRALLTLDLENGVSADERTKFYEYLEKEKWKKISDLTTTWKCSFSEHITRQEAIDISKEDVKNAARYSGVYRYNAALQVGEGLVEEF